MMRHFRERTCDTDWDSNTLHERYELLTTMALGKMTVEKFILLHYYLRIPA